MNTLGEQSLESNDFDESKQLQKSSKNSVFVNGEYIEDFLKHPNALKLLDTMQKHPPALVFDIDGVLIESGLEVGEKKDKSLDDYVKNHKAVIQRFQRRIQDLQQMFSAEIVICTGRGGIFAEKINQMIFGGKVDKIICEGGAMIIRQKGKNKKEEQIMPNIEENNKILQKWKGDLQEFVAEKEGSFEEGKKICLSFNPPPGVDIANFREEIENFLKKKGINLQNQIHVTNSSSAVDIMPSGVDKMYALQSELEKKSVVYFGDAPNDRTAMESVAHINIVPSNVHPVLFDEVLKKSGSGENPSFVGIQSSESEIRGVEQSLDVLRTLFSGCGKLQCSVASKCAGILDLLNKQTELKNLIEKHPDKFFYYAEGVEVLPNGNLVFRLADRPVRLNEKIPGDFPLVEDIRENAENSKSRLFSGVAALEISSKNGKIIPLLLRDAGAYTDAGKYTLPAGRADNLPGKVAYKELLEELVIFAKKDGKIVQIIPCIPGEISLKEIENFAQNARKKYIQSLLQKGKSPEELLPLLSAETEIALMQTKKSDKSSHFITPNGDIITEEGLFPYFDESARTYEIVRGFQLDLQEYDEIFFGDGDGFGREVQGVSVEEVKNLPCVASLQMALYGDGKTKSVL